MSVLSKALYTRCYDTLLKCSEFDSDASVSAIFVTTDLHPFKTGLPGANSKAARVTDVLGYLLEQEPEAGPPVLVSFLRALSGHYHQGNALLNDLVALTHDVEEELGVETPPGNLPDPHHPAAPGIDVTLLTEVLPTAYCYQLTSEKFPLVNVTIDNTGRGGANATMQVQAVIEGFSDHAVTTPQVTQGTQSRVTLLPTLRKETVEALNEIRPATLRVKVEQTAPATRLLHEQTYPIRLHALDTALLAVQGADGGIVDLSDYLAAWVTPHAPVIELWLRRAAEHHPNKSVVGYQGANTLAQGAEIVRAQAQAIFATLKQEANLIYINSALNMGRQAGQVTQRVRLPSESLSAGGSANCIDGTVLFASLLELASLEPVVVLVPGHAFVGWRIWQGVNQYEFLETTMIGSSDFASAQQVGQQEYEEALAKGYFSRGLFDPGGFARLVDIPACRMKGILPLE
ncbi:MAG: hypothetical protein JW963_03985 [Anaerolineales bacterium]|nr:hypothetical protein [Anaerolineales bacterium]